MFLSGIIFAVSVSISLTFLPIIIFLFLILALKVFQDKIMSLKIALKLFSTFFIGSILIPLIIFILYGLNPFEMLHQIMIFHNAAHTGRQYLPWIFYSLYDFLLFLGIPLALIYIKYLYQYIKLFSGNKHKTLKETDIYFLAFTVMLLIVDFSGSAPGENARVWTPYLALMLPFLANYITKDFSLSRRQFLSLLGVLALQVIIFQTVLVTVW